MGMLEKVNSNTRRSYPLLTKHLILTPFNENPIDKNQDINSNGETIMEDKVTVVSFGKIRRVTYYQ